MSDRSRTRRGLGRRRRRLLRPPPPSHDTPSTNTNTDQIPHVRQIHPTHLLDGPRCQVPSPPAARFRRTLTAPDTGFGTSSYPPTTTRSHRQQLSCDVKKAIRPATLQAMAHVSALSVALANPTQPTDVQSAGLGKNDFPAQGELHGALLTPPNSISPELAAHRAQPGRLSPPPINIEQEVDMHGEGDGQPDHDNTDTHGSGGTPLSKGALSGLDATGAISPDMLAKHHLPGIMLGNGPRPIRYVMGELTQTVPGFSRIPPAKARRLVVAALENRSGGGLDGNVAFCKTGWGRWDAHVKGTSRNSGVGSYEGRLSPPPSERSSYAVSHGDSAVHLPGQHLPTGYRDQHSGSWSSIREEDELDIDLDALEHEADKMSLDDGSPRDDESISIDDATEEEDLPPPGPRTVRKSPMPPVAAPRKNYNAISASYARRWSSSRSWSRRPSVPMQRPFQPASLPTSMHLDIPKSSATPEEQAAAAALLSMGSLGS
ncbi:DNA-binding proteins Bright/BRCAA1/RBP1 and proteins containing BRIGHT domain [Friedmanniomyces endolithicus]|uniref:DNA-binding proteins Bright/BRCAA1/RBP1 and proteins containing BRIGHT domain n=1 Tax=Friedmanniomyces endolithicus TaxID=329885 RepID=A0AAN6KQT4_9PEZI|nr:DNA-binding proteins Bright/BRCAA1/RBP1 and proteins containing BRIGHT domain [Friedmanniomyces endolithicus]KAK1007048.1 DNA-binding proteins Bright/BRCAA1/RBP1 and proteins containing BRIGHT domain [Friedmanniomyces endolithicus]KAK1027498.1 DNA-binding proteins Bright/BRCAA1/RBP1 and proteins containing BRIGHT domain [Friedmanniomyces endolithicus]